MKKHAFLIGINEYDNLNDLNFARQDAVDVATALRENYGFTRHEITLMTDNSDRNLRPSSVGGIENKFDNIIETDPNLDLLIFGFWGHGVFTDEQLYMCPSSASRRRIDQDALPLDSVKQFIAQVRAKNVFMILDCCQKQLGRGDTSDIMMTEANQQSLVGAARDIGLAIKQKTEAGGEDDFAPNVAILNSCKVGQCAYEWNERGHGIFTAYLLDAFNRRLDTVSSIVDHLGNQVPDTAQRLGFQAQRPFVQLDGAIKLPADKTKMQQFGDVFISYRHKNTDLTEGIEAELQNRGITYFIDKFGILPGNEYERVISEAMKRAKVVLFLWTPDAEDSIDMPKELNIARTLKLGIFPYMVGPFNIRSSQYLYSLAGLSRYEVEEQTSETIKKVVDSLEQMLGYKVEMANPVEVPKPEETPKWVEEVKPIVEHKTESSVSHGLSTPPTPVATITSRKQLQEKIVPLRNKLIELFVTYDAVLENYMPESNKAKQIESKILPIVPQIMEYCQVYRSYLELLYQQYLDEGMRSDAPKLKPLSNDLLFLSKLDKIMNIPLNISGCREVLRKLTNAGTRMVKTVNGVEFGFRWCPAGTFMMGSPENEEGRDSDENQHKVTLSQGFWMMETEVTVGMFKAFVSDTGYQSKGDTPYGWTGSTWEQDSKYSWQNPGFSQTDRQPVTCVSWDDSVAFCDWLSKKTGVSCQLPTEAQWEYACRAGTKGVYAGDLDAMAWYTKTTNDSGAKPVGTKQPNAWGLYDMHGNVWEWCSDWYGDYPYSAVTDPVGSANGSARVNRGGGWRSIARNCRSANRDGSAPDFRSYCLGFRCCVVQ